MAAKAVMQSSDFKSCWDSITQFFASEPGLKADVSSKMTDLWEVKNATLKAWMETSVYQGFDVKAFMLLMIRNRKAYATEEPNPITIDVKYDSAGTSKSFTFTNTESLMKDVCFLILIFLQRGSSWDKMEGKTNEGVISIMNVLKEKYKINTTKRAAGSSLDSAAVTLPRIAACFPIRILQFLEQGFGRIIIDPTVLTKAELPKWLQHPAAASAIPVNTPFAEIAALPIIVLGVWVLSDNVLHKKDGKFTPLVNILGYMEASRQTAAVPEQARINFLKAVGFMTEDSDGEDAVTTDCLDISVPEWVKLITGLRAADPGQ